MTEVKIYGCTECGHIDSFDADLIIQMNRTCGKCLRGQMNEITVQTGAMSGDVTKFFRKDE